MFAVRLMSVVSVCNQYDCIHSRANLGNLLMIGAVEQHKIAQLRSTSAPIKMPHAILAMQ